MFDAYNIPYCFQTIPALCEVFILEFHYELPHRYHQQKMIVYFLALELTEFSTSSDSELIFEFKVRTCSFFIKDIFIL